MEYSKGPITLTILDPSIDTEFASADITVKLAALGQVKEWALGKKQIPIGEPSIDILDAGAFGCKLMVSLCLRPTTSEAGILVTYKLPFRSRQAIDVWFKLENPKQTPAEESRQ